MDQEPRQTDKISNKLNIEYSPETGSIKPYQSEPTEIVPAGKEIDDIDLKKDYLTVRKNLREILMTGADAIDSVLTVAKESDSPRAYEVAAQLIKAVADVNKDLLDIHKKVKEIQEDDARPGKATSITNNSIFVGSTKDLQQIIKQRYKELVNPPKQNDVIDAEVSEVIDHDEQTG
jgi:hypothetical protein